MKTLRVLLLILILTFTFNLPLQTGYVYITKTGEKYHKATCRYLKYSKKRIGLIKAKDLGYTACKVCKPSQNIGFIPVITNNNLTNSSSKSTINTSSKKVTTSLCTGKTKLGKRCKRMTKNTDKRCYQH